MTLPFFSLSSHLSHFLSLSIPISIPYKYYHRHLLRAGADPNKGNIAGVAPIHLGIYIYIYIPL